MGLKLPATSLQWSQPSVPQPPPPPSSQALASAIASPSSTSSIRRSVSMCDIYGSALFGGQKPSRKLYKSQSCENLRSQFRPIRGALSSGLDSLPDDEFDEDSQESDNGFQLSEEGINGSGKDKSMEVSLARGVNGSRGEVNFFLKNTEDIPDRDEIVPPDIERVANSLGIPFSLRVIKRKRQWQDGLVEAGESARCSVKKAFSSMVFIIRELQSYTLHMREFLCYEDLRGVLASVQKEMNDSFVWLFQKIFSQTPNLMVYLMILLANYSVYSMSNNAAIAAPGQAYTISTIEEASVVEGKQKFESSVVKAFKLSSPSSSGKTTSIGGNNGGGGKCRTATSGTDGNDRSDGSNNYKTIAPHDVISSSGSLSETIREDSASKELSPDEETSIWESMVHEAYKMQVDTIGEALDHKTMLRFVSPVNARIEAEDSSEYVRTEFLYQTGLTRDPNNPLLLANYAQFLYLVARDYERAEEYFKRATEAEPKDGESFNKYANFLWMVRKDVWLAEEKFLEAIDVEPENSYYRANYTHFLWTTGGEDTCIL